MLNIKLGIILAVLIVLSIYPPEEVHSERLEQSYIPKVEKQPETELTHKEQLMRDAGIKKEDWNYANFIIHHESGWKHTVWNYEGSGAYGLCQTMLKTHGVDTHEFKTNPVTQLEWCNDYAYDRYGSWRKAQQFWKQNRWW